MKPESFEVTEYSGPGMDVNLAYRAIRQIMVEQDRRHPAEGLWVDMSGDHLRIHYHTYEMFLPQRRKQVEDRASTAIRETVTLLKREFKSRTKHDLKLVEQRELEADTVQKVSMNERYYYNLTRSYKLSWE